MFILAARKVLFSKKLENLNISIVNSEDQLKRPILLNSLRALWRHAGFAQTLAELKHYT